MDPDVLPDSPPSAATSSSQQEEGRKRKRQDSDSESGAESEISTSSASTEWPAGGPVQAGVITHEALREELNAAISEAVFKRVYFDEGPEFPDDPGSDADHDS